MNEMLSDTEFSEKLTCFIKVRGISAQHLHFDKPCHSVAEAAHASNTSEKDFIKSICFISENDSLIVAIVKGEDRVDKRAVAEFFEINKLQKATATEVLEKTGYPTGGVPPFGYPAYFVIDKRVFEKDIVYGGGGSGYSLIKLSPQEIVNITGASIADIRQK